MSNIKETNVSDLKPFLVRLTPISVAMLDKGSKIEEKTKASLINEAIEYYFTTGKHKLSDINNRLNKL